MELKEPPMPEIIGAVGSALVTSPHGASELPVGLIVALALLAFRMRPAPRERAEERWGDDRAPTRRA